MLKLLQLTDCHLMPEGGRIFELDPAERLAAAISDINRNHSDAALCVLTGDLTNEGDPDAYALLRDRLAALSVPYQLVLGNHDDREHMRAAFPDLVVDPHGFLQSVRITPQGRLVFLDTVEAGVHNGVYCADRLIWLEHVLTESKGEPVYIFMHHPPMSIAMSRLDQYGLVDREAFADLIRRFPISATSFSVTCTGRFPAVGSASHSPACLAPITRTSSISVRAERTFQVTSRQPTRLSS